MGTPHNEKCMKYKSKIENLKLDLMEREEKIEELEKKIEKLISINLIDIIKRKRIE